MQAVIYLLAQSSESHSALRAAEGLRTLHICRYVKYLHARGPWIFVYCSMCECGVSFFVFTHVIMVAAHILAFLILHSPARKFTPESDSFTVNGETTQLFSSAKRTNIAPGHGGLSKKKTDSSLKKSIKKNICFRSRCYTYTGVSNTQGGSPYNDIKTCGCMILPTGPLKRYPKLPQTPTKKEIPS